MYKVGQYLISVVYDVFSRISRGQKNVEKWFKRCKKIRGIEWCGFYLDILSQSEVTTL
jgi:hypothetical protein